MFFLIVLGPLPSGADTCGHGACPSSHDHGGSSLESQLKELQHLREGIATLDGRQAQRQRLLALRTRFKELAPQLPERSQNAVRDLAHELEKLDFALVQDGEAGEIKRRFDNVETLLDVLALQATAPKEPSRHQGALVAKPCGYCNGNGKDSWGNSCKACGADGWVLVAPDAPKCGNCGGAGKDSWGNACKICGADGWVSVVKNAPKCGNCKGAGKDSWGNICKGCKGTGWAIADTDNYHGYYEFKPCGYCSGNGKDSYGNPCKCCGADGWVQVPSTAPKCGGCKGAGKDSWGHICKGCKGTGWANVPTNPSYPPHPGHPGNHAHHHDSWSLQTCGYCKGMGRDSWGNLCKPCGGDGYVAIANTAVACGNCKGSGKDKWGNFCPGCQGTGWANTGQNPTWGGPEASAPCGYCKGTGKYGWGSACPHCGGDGYVNTPTDQKNCGYCKGTGKDRLGNSCPGCKGTGWARCVMEAPTSRP